MTSPPATSSHPLAALPEPHCPPGPHSRHSHSLFLSIPSPLTPEHLLPSANRQLLPYVLSGGVSNGASATTGQVWREAGKPTTQRWWPRSQETGCPAHTEGSASERAGGKERVLAPFPDVLSVLHGQLSRAVADRDGGSAGKGLLVHMSERKGF